MGLYNSADLGKQLSSSSKGKRSRIDDANSPESLKRAPGLSNATDEGAQEAPRKRLKDMTVEEQVERGKEKIMDFLTYAPRTRAELFEKLEKKGFKEVAIVAALDRLAEVGVIDDQKFANDWAYSRFHYANKAPYLIARELRQKGIEEELIAIAIEPFGDESTMRSKALEIASVKIRGIKKSSGSLNPQDIQKIAAHLARKGFPPNLCFEVAKEVAQAETDFDSGDHIE